MKDPVIIYFGLKARDFRATSLSRYCFSILYITLPHNLITNKLIDVIEQKTFNGEGAPYIACNDRGASFYFEKKKHLKYHA